MKTEKEFLESVYRKYNVSQKKKARKRKFFVSFALFLVICIGANLSLFFFNAKTPETTFSDDFPSVELSNENESKEIYFSEETVSKDDSNDEYISNDEYVSGAEEASGDEEVSEPSLNDLENERIVYGEKLLMSIPSEYFQESKETSSGVNCQNMSYFFAREEFDEVYYYVGIKAIITETEENEVEDNNEFINEFGTKAFREKNILALKEHFENLGLFVEYMEEYDLFVTYIKESDVERLQTDKAKLFVYHLPLDFQDKLQGLFIWK